MRFVLWSGKGDYLSWDDDRRYSVRWWVCAEYEIVEQRDTVYSESWWYWW